MPEIERLAGANALAEAAARWFLALAEAAITARGRFCVALAGGSTPKALYARLAQAGSKQPGFEAAVEPSYQVDWKCVHFFWGDERCVPPNHPDSNYGMACQALFEALPVPAGNIHRIPGELEPDRAAAEYEAELRTWFANEEFPRFDLILLGMGDDGHTVSLFPGSPALRERARWVVAVEHHTPPPPLVPRITLTPPVLNAAANVIFLVSGTGKAARLAQVLEGPYQPDQLPAQIVRPTNGRLIWLTTMDTSLHPG